MELIDLDNITICEKGNMKFERIDADTWTMYIFKDMPVTADVYGVHYSIPA